MVGGFLGAGKTTAVAKLARRFADRGLRVGLITNDQGSRLVDTAMLAAKGFSVEEIAGGCFCCRFNSLLEAARRLSAATRPDVFLAEPVGSCTDLVATVTYPLRRIYGNEFTIAPLSVLVDPVRALRVFELEAGARFSEKVRYIYEKQLEEADLIVINKCDVTERPRLDRLRTALAERFPRAALLEVSARTGAGLESWFERIAGGEQGRGTAMEVDYLTYAEGEALLGWLNATVRLSAATAFEGNGWLRDLAGRLQARLTAAGAEVAHLKMTLDPDTAFGDLAVINLVRNDFVPELSQELADPLREGELIVNVRAEAPPEVLRQALNDTLDEIAGPNAGAVAVAATVEHVEFFQPGKPEPTHRFTQPD